MIRKFRTPIMPLKLTGNLSAIFVIVFIALACMANAEAKEKCPQEMGFTVYSGLSLENSTVCILSNYESAKLLIKIASPSLKIENTLLIEASDISEAVVRLEQVNNKANLYFEYPNNVYLITIDANNGKLVESTHSIKTEALSDESVNSILTLRTKETYIISSDISTITKNSLFDAQKMEIASRATLKITSPKAYLWNNPGDAHPTKAYLIRGDEIEAIEYESGKLKVIYITKGGKRIEKWIDISSVI